MSDDITAGLTSAETDLLVQCEAVIERGVTIFTEVGTALITVRVNRLYRRDHATFEEYALSRWGLSNSHAYQLMNAAKVVELISSATEEEIILPTTESQTRALAPLLDEPEEMQQVWSETVERTEGKPTAAAIRDVRAERERAAADKAAKVADEKRQLQEDDNALRAAARGIAPETVAQALSDTQPTVDIRRLAEACRSFADSIRPIDPDSAARAEAGSGEIAAIREAFDLLVRFQSALGVHA